MDKTMYDPEAWVTGSRSRALSMNKVFNFVYGWMTLGLLLSGAIAWLTATRVDIATIATWMLPATIVELAIVFGLGFVGHKISALGALLGFLAFAAVNGFTLSVYFIAYDFGTLQSVFFITAGMFAGLALFGTVTKRDLSRVGGMCLMALWGLLLAMLVNWFMRSSMLDLLISIVGVLIFVGLSAWDAQKVRLLAEQQHSLDDGTVRKLGIFCALELYLDFINLFILLLRMFGGKGRD